jgi:hypothetical protein
VVPKNNNNRSEMTNNKCPNGLGPNFQQPAGLKVEPLSSK